MSRSSFIGRLLCVCPSVSICVFSFIDSMTGHCIGGNLYPICCINKTCRASDGTSFRTARPGGLFAFGTAVS